MTQKEIKVTISRFDPVQDREPHFQAYTVPVEVGTLSVLQVLDYIYENLDESLAYYDHAACAQGICSLCTMSINGKVARSCQFMVEDDITLEPTPKFEVVKDLVVKKGGKRNA